MGRRLLGQTAGIQPACSLLTMKAQRGWGIDFMAGATTDEWRSSFSHLSFDGYEQDQTVVLGTALSPDGTRNAGIILNDAPDQPITPQLYEEAERIKAMPHGQDRKKAWESFMKKYPALRGRVRCSVQTTDR